MSPIEWSAALGVGVAEIDVQHEDLFRRADRLAAALRKGDRAEVGPLLHSLFDDVARHLAAEERFMREMGFAEVEAHRAEHDAFRAEIGERTAEYEREGPTPRLALAVQNWFSDRLRRHVGGADAEIEPPDRRREP